MNHHLPAVMIFLLWLAVSDIARGAAPPTKGSSPELNEARQASWQLVLLVIEKLNNGDAKTFPGIAAWLKDFQRVAKGIDVKLTPDQWPAMDVDALVTRNPNYWQAYYEIAPGDPGLMLLHAALLLNGGEATRAIYLTAIAKQRPGIPKEIQTALDIVLSSAQKSGTKSNALVEAGIQLHDKGNYAGALKKYQEALAVWPQNGWAHYEMGYTILIQQMIAAGEKLPPPNGVVINSKRKPSAEEAAAFGKARWHDPFQFKAYQGDDKEVIRGLQSLLKRGLPAWQKIANDPNKMVDDQSLERLAAACQDANIHDLALSVRQIVAARRGRYAPDDHPFFTKSLVKLAPGPQTEAILERLAGDSLVARQLVKPEPTMRVAEPASGKAKVKAGPFRFDSLVLYQSPTMATRRMGEDLKNFAAYVKEIEAKSAAYWTARPKGKAQSMMIIAIIKPNTKARYWLTFGTDEISADVVDGFRIKLDEIASPNVQNGPLAFALSCSLWGAEPLVADRNSVPPAALLYPKDWVQLAMKKDVELKIPFSDEVIRIVWPD